MKDLRCSSSKNNSVCCETNGGCFRSDLVFFRIKYFPYKKEHLTSKTIFDYRKCSLVNVYYFTLSKFKSNCVWKNWNNLGPLCLTNMTHAKVLALIPRWLKLQLLPQPIQLPPQLPLLPHLPLQLPKQVRQVGQVGRSGRQVRQLGQVGRSGRQVRQVGR